MVEFQMLMVLFLSSLLLYLLFVVFKFLHKAWWAPIWMQRFMVSQGIKGPSYKFLHGNTKEILSLRQESGSKPMGLSHNIFPRLQPHFHLWTKLYGGNFLFWNGTKAQLFTTDLDLIKDVLNNKNGAYTKTESKGFLRSLVGEGLVMAEGDKWVKLRKLSNRAFHGESLKNMVPAMIASVETMLEKWKEYEYEDKEVEVLEEFRVLTSEVISRTAFGSSYLEGKHMFDMLTELSLIADRNALMIRFPGVSKIMRTSDDIEAEKLEKGMRDSVLELVKQREEKVAKGEVNDFGSDFLGFLVKANHEESGGNKVISAQELVDECKTFYLAGHETTRNLLAWTVLLLAIHDDWQAKARKEVLEIFGQQVPNSDGIARLKTMTMIINESLRLYPPASLVIRKVRRKVQVGKLVLPTNIELSIPILALHHDPNIWGPDVDLFNPERFSEGVAKATKNNTTAFIPFGFGPRTCVGLNFATTEAKITLCMILQRYSFTLSPAYIHSPTTLITTRPKHGVQSYENGDPMPSRMEHI
ncbi:Cytochrome P450 [Dillenia turbinata]|uniref:Cytochrome P450 n=1 Tax=Dillenia turbinata TaxID=194707 RepID=A0AAN8VJM2_9MAGN